MRWSKDNRDRQFNKWQKTQDPSEKKRLCPALELSEKKGETLDKAFTREIIRLDVKYEQ